MLFIKKTINIIFIIAVFTIFFNQKLYSEELQKKTAEQYYLDGMYYYTDRSYTSATEQFEALTKNYPYSNYTYQSLLMEAYLNYINDELVKVSGVVAVFVKLYPLDKELPYMMYLDAMSHYKQIKDETKNLNSVRSAMEIFSLLIEKYPEIKYDIDAKKKMDFLYKIQQLNDIRNAEFYQDKGDYITAIRRYTGMFNIYKGYLNKDIEERALCRIINLAKMLEMNEMSDKYKKILIEKYQNNKCFE